MKHAFKVLTYHGNEQKAHGLRVLTRQNKDTGKIGIFFKENFRLKGRAQAGA
jgi:hypothetical protein